VEPGKTFLLKGKSRSGTVESHMTQATSKKSRKEEKENNGKS
jgi:hypothetical protein